jgi:hypothetical protein
MRALGIWVSSQSPFNRYSLNFKPVCNKASGKVIHLGDTVGVTKTLLIVDHRCI